MGKLLAFMDAKVSVTEFPASDYVIEAPTLNHAVAPYELVKTMRASILTLGPLMARARSGARLATGRLRDWRASGGFAFECAGKNGRGDYHLARIHRSASARRVGTVEGAHIVFERITVTGTENILMAAALADGETVSGECGARAGSDGLGRACCARWERRLKAMASSTLRIRGVAELHGAEHSVIPDRIEAGTFLVAGAITGGDLTITNCEPEHLGAVIAKLREAGVASRS